MGKPMHRMKRPHKCSIEFLVALVMLLAFPAAAHGAFPGVNGKIAFVSGASNTQIYTMNSDGTNQVNRSGGTIVDNAPVWSPDGTKLAFYGFRTGDAEIFTMNADGTNPVNRSSNGARDSNPAWSPDGTKLAFQSNRDANNEIYVMNADGTNQVNLTTNAADDSEPRWSPDGTKIAFRRDTDIWTIDMSTMAQVNLSNDGNINFDGNPDWSPDGNSITFFRQPLGTPSTSEIYKMNADGSGKINLTNNAMSEVSPAWSPDGGKILFVRGSDIYVMNADGSGPVSLTAGTELEGAPNWQPLRSNGRIVFTSDRPGNNEIYSMNPSGGDLKRLTNDAASDSDPTWSRDGTKIAFVSNRSGNYDIWTMNADGTAQQNRTNDPAFDADPTWSPDGSQIAFTSFRPDQHIWKMNADGTSQTQLTSGTWSDGFPSWSPNGDWIVFQSTRDTNWNIYMTNASTGSVLGRVTENSADDVAPQWSSDGADIAFSSSRDGNYEIYTLNSNGPALGLNETRRTSNGSVDQYPAWSPDGKKIALETDRDGNSEVYTMDLNGANQINRTLDSHADGTPDWAPLIPIGYARPRGATPINFRLVPAFNACASPNGTHGAPLSSPSCGPPTQSSGFLTFSAPDRPAPYNTAADGTGLVTMKVFCMNGAVPPCTAAPGDQLDVSLTSTINGVRCVGVSGGCTATGGTYAGKLLLSTMIRMTDRFNGPSLAEGATATDVPLNFGVQCAVGACTLATSADAVTFGLVREQKRAVWALSQLQVLDGGPDGDFVPAPPPGAGSCPPVCFGNGGETVFLQQGLFVP
jgi:Tol biopolymer transport system component